MRPELRTFIENAKTDSSFRRRTIAEILKLRREDVLDAALLGGLTWIDIQSGIVQDGDFDPVVLKAYQLQYPDESLETGLADKFLEMKDDPDALQGLVSGLKGKVFEIQYIDTMNHEILADGYEAVMANSATQPGWDVAVHNSDGDIVQLIQLKATDSASYLRDAIERYPDIHIAVPSDVYEHFEKLPEFSDHLIDSGITSDHVIAPLSDATDLVDHVDGLHLFPGVGLGILAAHVGWQLWQAKLPQHRRTIFRRGLSRARHMIIANAVGAIAGYVLIPYAAPVAAIGTRLVLGRMEVSREFAEQQAARMDRVRTISQRLDALMLSPATGV